MTAPRLPVTVLLGTSLFLIGLASAAFAPYRAIAAIENLHIGNAVYAVVMTLSSIGTAAASLTLGSFADRVPDRRVLVLACAVVGAVAYGLLALLHSAAVYILVVCAVLPFGAALFSQTFSFSRAYYNQHQPSRAEFMMSALRTLFSVAWVVMPPVAGWLASRGSVFHVFGAAALAYVACALIVALLWAEPAA